MIYVISCHVGKILSVRLGQREGAVSLGNQNNKVHVRDKRSAFDLEYTLRICISSDHYHRLVIESSVNKRVPNFNKIECTLRLMMINQSSYH